MITFSAQRMIFAHAMDENEAQTIVIAHSVGRLVKCHTALSEGYTDNANSKENIELYQASLGH